jgi:hypothetical protein
LGTSKAAISLAQALAGIAVDGAGIARCDVRIVPWVSDVRDTARARACNHSSASGVGFDPVMTERVLDPTSMKLQDLIYMFSPIRVFMG